MAEHRRRVDKVLDPAFLSGQADWSLDELRSCHADCLEIETEVSYVRRVAQARLDILEAELDRRAAGGSVGALADLPGLPDDELRSTITQLGELERQASAQRRPSRGDRSPRGRPRRTSQGGAGVSLVHTRRATSRRA